MPEYAVEEQATGLGHAARLALRHARFVPVLSMLKDRLLGWKQSLLPRHPMAEAVGYALNQWRS